MAKKKIIIKKPAPVESPRSAVGVDTKHPDYVTYLDSWVKIRDCLAGEDVIKSKRTTYLPQPKGMSGEYADAYDSYIERAHFPLVTGYALTGALGIVITKIPEFNVPKKLEYILETATKDGRSLRQLFLDIIIEIFQTGRVPLLVDIVNGKNEFRFVPYKAEDFINWKMSDVKEEKSLTLAVLKESIYTGSNAFSHDKDTVYRTLTLDENGYYMSRVFTDKGLPANETYLTVPGYLGTNLEEIPLFMAGSINNSFNVQPIPLVSVANCSVQIYRKEADLANSEFLSCNPTLVITGASNDDDLPNVVGSSVMMAIPNDQARVYYTKTDTAALTHVKGHISDLYDEAIRHGVAILDARKGVEAAEALRIRQTTQSATIYSIFLSAITAITKGLELMCRWGGLNPKEVKVDAPTALTQGIPDASIIKAISEGYGGGVIPLTSIHRYLIDSGLLDQTISYQEYVKLLQQDNYEAMVNQRKKANGTPSATGEDPDGTSESDNVASTGSNRDAGTVEE